MTNRDEIILAEKYVCFAERDLVFRELRGVNDDEQRIAVHLDLGALMREVRIFHSQFVQMENTGELIEQGFVEVRAIRTHTNVAGSLRTSGISSSLIERVLPPP